MPAVFVDNGRDARRFVCEDLLAGECDAGICKTNRSKMNNFRAWCLTCYLGIKSINLQSLQKNKKLQKETSLKLNSSSCILACYGKHLINLRYL